MSKVFASALVAAFALGGAAGAFALLDRPAVDSIPAPHSSLPVWTEVAWPFPVDQWGRGRAFQCKPADCGAAVSLYLRAKIGSCNCTTGIADDADLDRMSDFDLVGGAISPQGAGWPISVAWMKGRSRAYTLTARNRPGRTALSIAFNDRCDMVVATVVLPYDQPTAIEPDVLAFLNSRTVLHWAEVALGL